MKFNHDPICFALHNTAQNIWHWWSIIFENVYRVFLVILYMNYVHEGKGVGVAYELRVSWDHTKRISIFQEWVFRHESKLP